MGSKLNFAGSLGPSGQTNVATGLYAGEVSFFSARRRPRVRTGMATD